MAAPEEDTVSIESQLTAAKAFWLAQTHPYFKQGCLTDLEYRWRDCALVLAVSSISTKKYGLVKSVYNKYPYGDIISVRRSDGVKAIHADRLVPGEVIFCSPPPNLFRLPMIINAVVKYNYGLEFEINSRSQAYLENVKESEDMNYINGLLTDTLPQRRKAFRLCLEEMADMASKLPIKKFVIPLGFGRGVADIEWVEEYYPNIMLFNQRLKILNKSCIIVYSKYQYIPDDLKCLV